MWDSAASIAKPLTAWYRVEARGRHPREHTTVENDAAGGGAASGARDNRSAILAQHVSGVWTYRCGRLQAHGRAAPGSVVSYPFKG